MITDTALSVEIGYSAPIGPFGGHSASILALKNGTDPVGRTPRENGAPGKVPADDSPVGSIPAAPPIFFVPSRRSERQLTSQN
jgi:hypothetical protein